ncbi:MAG: aldehyde ferredoxin oxidoreductase family protein [Candidatus Bathyarchaeota archaeon]|nr:aldehyde ferredoxin oxidoreductase family protein [Candidatus Bathyarchaeota archaeon]
MYAYAGKILRVNLTTGEISTEPLSEKLAKDYIGGIGLGIKLLMDNSKPMTDAYDPDNPLIYMTGPLSGTMGPTGGNSYAVVSKSPATGGIGNAEAHGFFGPDFKRAGYDAIIITGKSPKLCYLWIDDDKVEIVPAEHMRNFTVGETDHAIREEQNDFYIRVSAIGEAGEKLCRFAAIMNDEFRAIGRSGMGGVMGSKNLKAVAVRGTKDVNVADMKGFREFVKLIHERMQGPATKKYKTLGTPENVLVLNSLAALATRNWTNATFEGAQKVSGEYLNEHYVKKIVGCATCGMRCDHIAVVPEGPYKGSTSRLEFECLWSMGPLCGIDRLDAVVEAMRIVNEYGMDGISIGVVVAFAMDCYEHGVITKEQTDGIDLRFGNAEAMIQIIHKIGKREGWLGSALAEGTKMAAEIIGGDAYKYACHIKGLELPGYDLRTLKTAALGFSVSFRGACHLRNGAYSPDVKGKVNRFKIEPGRGKIIATESKMYNIIDSLIVCKFSRGTYYDGWTDLVNYYTLATGIPITEEEMMMDGERIEVLARLFNLREGKGTREYDHLPWKIQNVPVPDEGPAKGVCVSEEELQVGLSDYYEARNWTQDGIPTLEKIKEVGLDEYAYIAEEAKERVKASKAKAKAKDNDKAKAPQTAKAAAGGA